MKIYAIARPLPLSRTDKWGLYRVREHNGIFIIDADICRGFMNSIRAENFARARAWLAGEVLLSGSYYIRDGELRQRRCLGQAFSSELSLLAIMADLALSSNGAIAAC